MMQPLGPQMQLWQGKHLQQEQLQHLFITHLQPPLRPAQKHLPHATNGRHTAPMQQLSEHSPQHEQHPHPFGSGR